MKDLPNWIKEEEELFKETWSSGDYPLEDIAQLFQRSTDALRKKAKSMGLESISTIEAKLRVKAIKKALEEELII